MRKKIQKYELTPFEHLMSICVKKEGENLGYEYISKLIYDEKDEKEEKPIGFAVLWASGGASGGSCWGGVAEKYSTNNKPVELNALYKILELIHPEISFLKYKNNILPLIDSYSEQEREYYGNYTTYSGLMIKSDQLFESLKNMGVDLSNEKINQAISEIEKNNHKIKLK